MDEIEAALANLLSARERLNEQLTGVNQAIAWLGGPTDDGTYPLQGVEGETNDLALEDDELVTVVTSTPGTAASWGPAPEPAVVEYEVSAKAVTTTANRSTPDYEAIAAWINEAKATGTYGQQAMEDHFGVPRTTVKNWMTRCKQLGLLDSETTWTNEPIGKVGFDEQKARDAAAMAS